MIFSLREVEMVVVVGGGDVVIVIKNDARVRDVECALMLLLLMLFHRRR